MQIYIYTQNEDVDTRYQMTNMSNAMYLFLLSRYLVVARNLEKGPQNFSQSVEINLARVRTTRCKESSSKIRTKTITGSVQSTVLRKLAKPCRTRLYICTEYTCSWPLQKGLRHLPKVRSLKLGPDFARRNWLSSETGGKKWNGRIFIG